MIYITGDTHGNFNHIERFCFENKTTVDDVLIILGDSGINYAVNKYSPYEEKYEQHWQCTQQKDYLANFPITFFCIHGNHEARANTVQGYEEINRYGGVVWMEEKYPNLLFAKDGEIYSFNDKQYIVIGGAYSIDKNYRLQMAQLGDYRYRWFPDEQPSKEIKQKVESVLDTQSWEIHGVLSHTAPLKYEPTELFLKGIDQSKVDKTTEIWLDAIENRLDYSIWYFGHYHGHKEIDRMRMLFHSIEELK